ncbi:AlpA family phage regulatory protein [Xenorhabdus nematophila]|uniref:AlpA family phage regulatory protein n=1 Tax=Xenorhabdus nematophila TaxID=628 RepID=UPI0005421675|nr:AlpA family phage regulatory protein [Xenorhabdus nematophila]CEF32695.1 Predicted phage transcriptional regulator [Xenorhabdus nematophila str. Websteri]AYA41144.1 AlpA family phage regulatory protein [Xenorhabdus nematophila]MBA0019893.1 AlpA family phage regulatory protein [Xenorhabdus nematophila]MCB4426301.1 AlpA family phage regulatory protein [Xenorhabdus nematophila]QNJ35545.1 AlpA family phage regulatory protein [Xenorhabdus nematophila]
METLTFIRLDYVMQKTGLEKLQIDHLIRLGNFPKPRRLGIRSMLWIAEEVDEWAANKARKTT